VIEFAVGEPIPDKMMIVIYPKDDSLFGKGTVVRIHYRLLSVVP